MESVDDILSLWMNDKKDELIQTYRDKGLKASGNFERNIFIEAKPNESSMLAPKYIGALINGRKKNIKQDPESLKKWVGWAGSTFLKEWVDNKGLSISPFAVAWGIAREGITVPNKYNDGRLLKDVFGKNSIDTLKNKIGNFYTTQTTSNIQEAWQQL
jgi:hypothetical protein